MITKFLKQPLLHFLLIGVAFFLIFHLTSSNNNLENDLKTVVVDKNSLVTFMQYRSKKFNQDEFEAKLKNMPETELNNLIEDYVREEVLYREALGLGMDKDDYLIRRRMVQKIEFINEQLNNSQNITRQEVKDYYNKNLDDYKVEPNATFTHVYFSNDKNGTDEAKQLAEKELIILNKNKVPFSDSVKHGDRFLYHLNYVERTPEFVESHFGTKMSEEIFNLAPDQTNWYGPFKSQYGYHLVLLADKKDEVIPALEVVRDSIIQDLNYKLSNEAKEKSIKDIIDSYDVRITYKKDGPGTEK